MSSVLPPIPFKSQPLDQNGFFSEVWTKYFLQLFNRTGGQIALTNTELETTVVSNNTAIIALQNNQVVILTICDQNTNNIAFLASQIDGLLQGRQL